MRNITGLEFAALSLTHERPSALLVSSQYEVIFSEDLRQKDFADFRATLILSWPV